MRTERPSLAHRCRAAIGAALLISSASILTACAVVSSALWASLAWTDLLHVNPGRTTSELLETMLVSPLYGVVLGVLWFGLPLVVGGVFAGVSIFAQGRLSRAAFAGVVAITTAFFVWSLVSGSPAVDDVSGETLDGPPWPSLVGGSVLLVVALYAGRRFARRRLTAGGTRSAA